MAQVPPAASPPVPEKTIPRSLDERRNTLLVIGAGGVALALLVVLSILLYSRANGALSDQAERQVRDAATLAAQLVGEQTLRFSETVGAHATHLGALADAPLEKLSPRQRALAVAQLRELQGGTRGLRSAGLVSPSGRLLVADPPVPELEGRSFAFRDWYRGVTSLRSPYVSRVFRASGAGKPKTVTVAALVRSEGSREVIAILTASLERRTQELVTEFSRTQGLGLVVTDQAGDVVALSGVSSDRIVSMRDDGLVRAALDGRSGTSVTDDAIAGYAPVPGIGWTVSARLPTDVALRDVHELRTLAVVLTGIVGLLLGALTFGVLWFQRRFQALQLAQSKRRQAMHLNDGVVQTLTVAQAAREVGDAALADRAVADALAESKRITADLLPDDLAPGSLVRPETPRT
jgi:hypothetical protein